MTVISTNGIDSFSNNNKRATTSDHLLASRATEHAEFVDPGNSLSAIKTACRPNYRLVAILTSLVRVIYPLITRKDKCFNMNNPMKPLL